MEEAPMYTIRKATLEDVDKLVQITKEAQARMAAMHLDQWQKGEPNSQTWTTSIEKEEAYVVLIDGVIAAAFVFAVGQDASYEQIEGKWLQDGDYITIHRLCVSDAYLHKGIASFVIQAAKDMAKVMMLPAVRFDTHRDNILIQGLAKKEGFTYCGVIHLVSGAEKGRERLAYEYEMPR